LLGQPIKVGAVNERIKLQWLSDRRLETLFHGREIELTQGIGTCLVHPASSPAESDQRLTPVASSHSYS